MRAFRRLLPLLILVCALCLLLCGCGQAADSSGLSGNYDLLGAEDAGLHLTDEAAVRAPLHLRLDPGGTGVVTDGERTGRLTWSVNDGFVMVEAGGILLGGNAEGTELLLKAAGSDTVLRFIPSAVASVDENSSAFPSGEDVAAATRREAGPLGEEVPPAGDPAGEWYGWWKITDSDGRMPLSWYDCCARLIQTEDTAYLLTVWDEESSAEAPLASVTFREEGDGHLVSLYGTFLYDDIGYGEWKLDLPAEVLSMEDLKHDADDTVFTCSFYLRSWGDRWQDSPEEQRPFYFDDWYLPLIKKNAPMPDSIPVADIERERES